MEEANRGNAPSYGTDIWTERAANLLRELFETDNAKFLCLQRDCGEFAFAGFVLPVLSQRHLP